MAYATILGAALSILPAAAASKPGLTTARIGERDFRISAPKHVRPGHVRLVVHNDGPDTHELIVVRAGGGQLPLRADGLTVDEEALHSREPGALEPAWPGSTRTLDLRLAPGRYVLLCNMAGHYLGGMHTTLVVR